MVDKIVLVSLNSKYSHTNLAMLYLKEALTQTENVNCQHIEWDINRPLDDLLELIVSANGTHILFSAYIWNSTGLMKLIPDTARLLPDAVTGTGGPEAVNSPDKWLKVKGLDYIMDGNAEDFAGILPGLKKPAQPEILHLPPAGLEKTPFPYSEENLEKFKNRIIYYETTRGCIFRCSYCLSAEDRASGRASSGRRRTDRQIKSEYEILRRFEGTVKFVDRTFNADRTISRQLWSMMAENPPAGCFHFELHPALLQEDDFLLIGQLPAGSAQFEIGIQSTAPEIIRNIHRKDNWPESKKAVERLVKMRRFHIHLDQIIGLPGDTPATAAASLEEILSLQPDVFQPGFLKLLPGTPLEKTAEDFGITASASPPYEVMKTGTFGYKELRYFKKITRLIDNLYNSGFFKMTLPAMAELSGGWIPLLDSILNYSDIAGEKADINCRRWDYWGKILLKTAGTQNPDAEEHIIDTLRLDWCPFASSNRYPDFIKYENTGEMDKLKTKLSVELQKKQPELKKSSMKRAILFVSKDTRKLYVKINGEIKNFIV